MFHSPPKCGDLLKSSTIFAASVMWGGQCRQLLVRDPRIDLLPDGAAGPRRFKIKSAESDAIRSRVNSLLKSRYGWRGYTEVSLPTDRSVHKFTLSAAEQDTVIGTITVAFDGPKGLSADDAFGPEVARLRSQGRCLCEFTKLAIDPTVGTKRVLAALFHVAYIVAHRIRGHDLLLIEVNPRHVRYYERMLGFTVISEERTNKSVNAPAVLLSLEFSYVMQQIGRFGGNPQLMSSERTLYPGVFSLREETAILSRMQSKQRLLDRRLSDTGSPAGLDEIAVSDFGGLGVETGPTMTVSRHSAN